MSIRPRVLHIAPSPLVGAPLKIANLLRSYGVPSCSFAEHDYPSNGPLFKIFTDGTHVISDNASKVSAHLIRELEHCDIVHVHNYVKPETAFLIGRHAPNAKLVYHVHSPLKEGPLYIDRSETLDLDFDAKLVVAQYQPRLFPQFTPVPNIVPAVPSVNFREDGEPLRICYSPTHGRGGRWNAKTNELFEEAMSTVTKLPRVELVVPNAPIPPASLLALRRTAHLSIDEVLTGAFHQVSLESMVCGNVTVNGADHFAIASLADCCGAPLAEVPFVISSPAALIETIYEFARDCAQTRESQRRAYQFADAYMRPDRIANIYMRVYESLFHSDTNTA